MDPSTGPAWQREGDGYVCAVHARRFAAGHSCPDCARPAPGANETVVAEVVDDSLALAPPVGALTMAEHEIGLCAIASFASGLALKGSRMQHTHRIKYLELAIKAHRAGADLAGNRERRDTLRELERRLRRMRAGQRPRGVRH